MAKKSEILVTQIKSLRERKQFDTLWETKPSLVSINILFKKFKEVDVFTRQIYLKYIVVTLVSIVESFMRTAIAKLIDKGDPYTENSRSLLENNKIDFDSFNNIFKKEFSFGEFVSHQLSCSKIEDFIGVFKIIFNKELFAALEEADIPKAKHNFKASVNSFMEDYNSRIKSIQRIFELRHIICHENSLRNNINEKEIRAGYFSIAILLGLCGDFVAYIIDPIIFHTLDEQIEEYEKLFKHQKEIISQLISKIEKNPVNIWDESIDFKLFIDSQNIWEKYAEKQAELSSNIIFEGKTLSPKLSKLEYIEEITFQYDLRIGDLKADFE